ncbi:uncharacterized protein N7479_008058 [Penicillium vulpinum]|uniref:uncharacterized protein n=1 Tax=Penicillium vulpinum TaxID=29845 RepID=UPI002547033B|nr:uncharacterized protein N7479_008058 [Penicillium vulpinum]KAJ5960908.1 hypothetical protein N7479_008058 [Penicillium vulpinum]
MAGSLDLLSEASCLRLGVPCSLADEYPCHGGSHRVFEVVFEDSVRWAARVHTDSNNWKNELRAVRQFQYINSNAQRSKR